MVTFEATAIVCLPEEVDNQCVLGCSGCIGDIIDIGDLDLGRDVTRKRRSLDVNRVKETKFYLKAGPYKFSNVNKKNQQGMRAF